MNWSVYSKFVGNVFGAPLAIEGLAAFFLESTFLGLWIFGWNRLSPRVHLAALWIAVARHLALGLLHPRRKLVHAGSGGVQDRERPGGADQRVGAALEPLGHYAFVHTILAGLTCGSAVVFGVCCWHFARGRNVELFRPAAKVALIVLVPVSCFNMWFGSHFGILVTELQPMKISAAEAQWEDCQKCAFSLFQVGGFTESDQTPSFSIEVPGLLSYLSTGSFNGKVTGLTELNKQYERQYGRGNYMPPVEAIYWSMRGHGVRRLDRGAGGGGRRVPVLEAAAGAAQVVPLDRGRDELRAVRRQHVRLVLTEVGRQPWIVQGLLKTSNANSPAVGTTWLAISLAVFVTLYVILGVLDVWLMRRYAGRDPSTLGGEPGEASPAPAIGY